VHLVFGISTVTGRPDLISARADMFLGFRDTQTPTFLTTSSASKRLSLATKPRPARENIPSAPAQLSDNCPFLYSPLPDELVRLAS
jgi:hypothetical protein